MGIILKLRKAADPVYSLFRKSSSSNYSGPCVFFFLLLSPVLDCLTPLSGECPGTLSSEKANCSQQARTAFLHLICQTKSLF